MNERNQISEKAVEEYLSYKPDVLATACPLCKKTFAKSRKLQVNDIAEIVYMAIAEPEKVEEKIESVRKTAIV